MKQLSLFESAHARIDEWLEEQWEQARLAGDQIKQTNIDERRRVNDYAYFVLCWGQIELAVNNAALAVVRKYRAHVDRSRRRAWGVFEIANGDRLRLSFDRRAALVLDPSVPTGPYARLLQHYEMRNRIAHGAVVTQSIDLDNVIKDFYIIHAALEP